MNKDLFNLTAINFEELTGIPVEYVKQYGNGSWLWLHTEDNNGEGFAIGVNGYIDAANILDEIKIGYMLHKTGRVCK